MYLSAEEVKSPSVVNAYRCQHTLLPHVSDYYDRIFNRSNFRTIYHHSKDCYTHSPKVLDSWLFTKSGLGYHIFQ